jgi:hypothetical protein
MNHSCSCIRYHYIHTISFDLHMKRGLNNWLQYIKAFIKRNSVKILSEIFFQKVLCAPCSSAEFRADRSSFNFSAIFQIWVPLSLNHRMDRVNRTIKDITVIKKILDQLCTWAEVGGEEKGDRGGRLAGLGGSMRTRQPRGTAGRNSMSSIW